VTTSLWARALVLFPRAIGDRLARIEASGLVPRVPTVPQIALGIARMHYRLLTRPESVGTCIAHPVRASWRARLLEPRVARFPFLVRERAIAPLDFSGLASPRERILRHLLAAHHDGHQFAYDLELLGIHPGALEELHDRARAVVDGTDPRAAWLRDLCVYEGYHEHLLEIVAAVLAGTPVLETLPPHEANDPDVTLTAYLRWCAAQPEDLGGVIDAWLEGELSFAAYVPESAS
jgi:hypothetical protein